MQITATMLVDLRNRDGFLAIYPEFVIDVLANARLFPKFGIQRLVEAHGAWLNDLQRVTEHEPHLDDGMDHFKQAGHLAFWLRRLGPVIEAYDLTKNEADAPGYPLSNDENAFRELLFGYTNEYLAFDFGYQICKFHETAKAGGSARADSLCPTIDFYQTTCHFMKYKNVSPHALFLVYKSLFLE